MKLSQVSKYLQIAHKVGDITTYRTEEYLFIFTTQLAVAFPFVPKQLEYKQTSVYHPFLYYAPYEVDTTKVIYTDGHTELKKDFDAFQKWQDFHQMPTDAMCDITSYIYESSELLFRMAWTYTPGQNGGPNGRVFIHRYLTDIFDKRVETLRLNTYSLLQDGWISVLEPDNKLLAYIHAEEFTVNDHVDLVADHYNKLAYYASKGIILKT